MGVVIMAGNLAPYVAHALHFKYVAFVLSNRYNYIITLRARLHFFAAAVLQVWHQITLLKKRGTKCFNYTNRAYMLLQLRDKTEPCA